MINVMRNIGAIEAHGKLMPVQVSGRQIYISGYPIEQYQRELRERALDMVREKTKKPDQ